MKSLTASKNTEERFDHSGTTVLLKRVPLSQINFMEEFKTLLPINPATLEIIKDSIRKYGYDESQPVHVWKERNCLIDGHTRFQASKDLGLYDIPIYEHSLGNSLKDVMQYVATLQVARRNLTDAEILTFIEKLGIYGLTAKEISETLDISIRKVERARSVLNNATEEQIEQIKSGEKTINSVLTTNTNKKNTNATEELEEDLSIELEDEIPPNDGAEKKSSSKNNNENFDDDLSDSLSDNEGIPAGLNFSHSDGIERPSYRLSPEEDSERTKERKAAYEAGLKKGSDLAYEVYDFILSEIESGKSAEKIRNDSHFDDFSVSRIYRAFNLSDEQKQEEEKSSDSDNGDSGISDFDDDIIMGESV